MESGRVVPRRRKVGVLFMLTGLLSGLLAVIAPTVSAEPLNPGTLGNFENEGDQNDATLNTGTIDWETVKTDPRITEWVLIHDDNDPDTNDSSYIDSAKEQDPSTWACAANEAPPKDDLYRLYLASQVTADDQFLHIGYVRNAVEGDTDINLEFNQVTGDFSCPGGVGRVRSRDDLMLSFTFPGGADPAVINVYRWDTTAASDGPGDPDPSVTGNDFVPGDGHWDLVALAPNVAAGADNSTFGDDKGEALILDQFFDDSPLEPRAFGEITIDLEATFGSLLDCPGTGFVTGHSRASHSFASDLKDIFPETAFDLSDCAKIKIKKVDNSVPPVAQQGAVYGLYDSLAKAQAVAGQTDDAAKAAAVDWCTTGADGTCLLDKADPDNDYWITEITPPAGLLPSTEIRAVTAAQLEPFTTLDLSSAPFVNNVPVGNVTITKRLFNDLNENSVLDPGEQITPDQMSDLNGISFALQKNAVTVNTHPANLPATCTISGGTGQCTISSVPLGTYDILETLNPNGPSGIGLGDSPSVTITTNGQTVTANYDNPLDPINIALDKLGDRDTASIGDTVNYSFTVTTTGVRLHNVTLEEFTGVFQTVSYADICDSGPTFSAALSTGEDDGFLEVGDAFVWTCPHLVTPSDPDPLPNRAHANGVDDVGRTADAYDIFNVDILYPDLQVVKQAADGVDAGTAPSGNETIDAPGTATYTITVTNIGAGMARNATLTDTLPAGSWTVTQTSANDGNDVCPVGGNPKIGSFSCTFGDLAPGATKTVTVSRAVTIASDCAAVLVNNAGVATTYQTVDIDPNSANDTSSATINVRCPDVGVVKTTTNSPISAGERAEWSITLTNNGAGVANDVFLVDTIPAGLTDLQLTGADSASCSLVGHQLTCDFGDLPPNDGAPGGPDTRVITVSGLTDQADCATIPNTATVASTSQGAPYVDSNPANNTSTANVVVQCPDLVIDKSTTTGTVSAGQSISFDITVTNNGPGIAFGVTLTDTLPTGTGISWSENSTSCSIAAGVLSCSFGDLADDQSVSVTLTSGTTEASCKTYDNTATADATNDSPVNDSASAVVQCPNISISKSADAAVVDAGDDIGFTVTVSNSAAAGTGTAFGVTLSDPLPAGDGIDWSIQSQSGGAGCTITGAVGAEVLSCGPKDLAPGASFSVHIVSDTQPTGEICSAATLPNTATADATNDAPVQASATTSVQCPDIGVTKVADDVSVSAGEQIGFTITVSNGGPGVAYGVTLSDPMPAGVNWTLESSTPSAGCSLSAGDLLTCGPVDLASGASFSAHLVADTTEDDCALYENTASADASNDAPLTASDDSLVKCPGLNITKDADDPETVTAGDVVGFTIEVTNDAGEGVGTALGVTLNDPLPAGDGVSWTVESQTGGAGCVVNGIAPNQTLVCGPIDLDPGEGFSVHLVSNTDPSGEECVAGTLPNTATADASNHAPITASDTIAIECPDITITKVADADVVDAGDDIGFTISVSNAGPGIARDVTISDPLPAGDGVVWTVDPAVEGCTILLSTLLCQVGDLDPEDTFSVHVTGTTPGGIGNPDLPAACKVYDNTATAALTNDADETASDSTEVICPLDITIVKDGPDLAHRGDEITYTFTVTNSGEADLVEVVLTDPICDEGTLELVDDADGDATLAIGEEWTYECTRVITATDPDPLPNTATVVGTDVRDRTTDDTDDHLVDLIAPAIQVVKTVDDATPDVGQTVTFTYVVTNTGDTTLFNVTVVDDKLGPIGTIAELAAGASATLTKTMVVAADSPALNIATATGADVLGKTVTDDDPETITIVLGEVVVKPKVVAPAQLPRTGADSRQLLLLSGLLLVLGGLMVASGQSGTLRTARRRHS